MLISTRSLVLALAVLLAGAVHATDVAALQARGTTPQTAVRTMVARGGSVTDIARHLKDQYRLKSDEAARLLVNAGFDERSVTDAIRSVYGNAPTAAPRVRRGIPSGVPQNRPGTRNARPSTRGSQPATQAGPPSAIGPSQPRASVSLVSLGPTGLATIAVASDDSPTAMRIANNVAELPTAPWQPYQTTANFTVNGFFPVQAVVQVGVPAGPGSHPVNGPHVVSRPQTTLRSPGNAVATTLVGSHMSVESWQPDGGGPARSDFAYRDTYGTLTLRLEGLGDVEELQFSSLRPCSPNVFRQESMEVSKTGTGSYSIEFRGYVEAFETPDSPSCVHQAYIRGKGGNFEPSVSYSLFEVDDGFRFTDLPNQSTDQTFDFPYGPKVEFVGPLPSLATSDCKVTRSPTGKLILEMRSGPVAANCEFRSRAVFLPMGIDLTALHWNVEDLPSGGSGTSHCRVVPIPSGVTNTHMGIDPGVTNYFNTTDGAFTPTADIPPPPPGENWSESKSRDWLVPLTAQLRCDAHVAVGDGLEVDRIRLVLDRIEYRAAPGRF